ncbi:hypothetical protein [Sphingobacterium sp. HMA12]|uniref:hypothetical protein n=1 Tax=Sphingobacterium sp. HMA12 TaxID=2050894 RepID=UPI000CE9C1B2|nr:hypothetical protein [Sphingobacterium sp. HMA12]
MKGGFTFFLTIVFALQSCNYKSQDQIEQKVAPTKKEAIVHIDTLRKIGTSSRSFIGKTTEDIEVSQMHTCLGVMLPVNEPKAKFALAQYSAIIDHCQRGRTKFVIERFLRYDANGKSVFVIVDELNVETNYPATCFGNFRLAIEDDREENYIVTYYDNNSEVITQISRIWHIDLEKEKFVEVCKPKNLTLTNPDYVESDEDPAFKFPSTGEKAGDFIGDPRVFEIQYETAEMTNTMKKDMPAKSKRFKTAKQRYLIEETSLNSVLKVASKVVNGNS